MRRDRSGHVPRGLVRPEIAADGEDRLNIALRSPFQLGIGARQRTEVPGEVRPVLDVDENIEQIPCGHLLRDIGLQRYRRFRNLLSCDLLQYRLAGWTDGEVSILRIFLIY